MIAGFYKPFRRYVRKHDIDIVMLMGNYPALITLCARLGLKAKFVYCDHGGLMNQWHQKDIRFIRRFDSLFCDKLVVLTEQTKLDYMEKFHIPESKVDYIYNWISDDMRDYNGKYAVESKKILSVGRITHEKGYDLLVKVAALVLPKHPEWSWDVYGDGEDREKIEAEICENHMQEQLHLMGNHPHIEQVYPQYAMLVMPSYREGLPLCLIEAKAFHLPIVCFDIQTGPREIVVKDIDGFLIEPYDVEKMAGAIERLMTDAALRTSFSKHT